MNVEEPEPQTKPRISIEKILLYGILFFVVYIICMVAKFFLFPAKLEIGPETTVISERNRSRLGVNVYAG